MTSFFSLRTLANVFFSLLFLVKFCLGDYSLLFALEINRKADLSKNIWDLALPQLKALHLHYHNAYSAPNVGGW